MQRYAPLLSAPALWLLRDCATRHWRASPHRPGRGRLADARPGGDRQPVYAHRAARRHSARGALLVQKPAVRFLPAAGLAIGLHAVLGADRDSLGSPAVARRYPRHSAGRDRGEGAGVRDADRPRSHRRRLLCRRAADEGAAGGTGRPRPDRPRRAAAGLATRSQRRAASARIRVCDAVHHERLSGGG